MDKREAASIILDCISRRVVLPWDDCQTLAAAVEEALEEIGRRRQEAGPAVVEMRRPRCGNTKGQRKTVHPYYMVNRRKKQ